MHIWPTLKCAFVCQVKISVSGLTHQKCLSPEKDVMWRSTSSVNFRCCDNWCIFSSDPVFHLAARQVGTQMLNAQHSGNVLGWLLWESSPALGGGPHLSSKQFRRKHYCHLLCLIACCVLLSLSSPGVNPGDGGVNLNAAFSQQVECRLMSTCISALYLCVTHGSEQKEKTAVPRRY